MALTMSFLSEVFSQRMKEIRAEMDLTQAEAAVLIKTDPANISRWESGKYIPTEEALLQIEAGYKIDAKNFFGKSIERADLVLNITRGLGALDEHQLREVDNMITLLTEASSLGSSASGE